MSNVLIGIIGVILFIGLALAGALILGDDFRTASSSSQAAATVSQLQQVQAAVEMYRLKTGRRTIMTQNTNFLVPRFLKTPAINPTNYGRTAHVAYWHAAFLNNDTDSNGDNEGMGMVASLAMILVGPTTDNKARDICLAIEEGQGRSTIVSNRWPTNPIGCVMTGNGEAHYVAYANFGP